MPQNTYTTQFLILPFPFKIILEFKQVFHAICDVNALTHVRTYIPGGGCKEMSYFACKYFRYHLKLQNDIKVLRKR